MLLSVSFRQLAKWFQKAAIGIIGFLLCFNLLGTGSGLSSASASPFSWVTQAIAQASTEIPDVHKAAEQADEASEQIYEGLDTTKRVIGKTEKRNEVIERAREHASGKLKSLAEKAKDAEAGKTSLTAPEQQVLKQVQD